MNALRVSGNNSPRSGEQLKMAEESSQQHSRTRVQGIFGCLNRLWMKANIDWTEAAEVQRRIDETREKARVKYDHFRWHI